MTVPLALTRPLFPSGGPGAKGSTRPQCWRRLIDTWKLHSVNPHVYLTDVADKARQQLAQPPNRRIATLGLDRRTTLIRQAPIMEVRTPDGNCAYQLANYLAN